MAIGITRVDIDGFHDLLLASRADRSNPPPSILAPGAAPAQGKNALADRTKDPLDGGLAHLHAGIAVQ
jgi:hypothetical protein